MAYLKYTHIRVLLLMADLGPSGVIFFSFRICHLEPNLMKKEHNQEGTKLKYTD